MDTAKIFKLADEMGREIFKGEGFKKEREKMMRKLIDIEHLAMKVEKMAGSF